MIKHQKPASFYDTYERKGPGNRVVHYCPGCGHGTVHKMIAEAISDLGIQDKTVFCSPVGCSVFGYYYFDTGNIQCAHGRAPAVATAVRRSRDSVVISYQGDGDLAGIGMSGIVHAANRGEKIVVIFINNAIYGMTGGQMAPTTLINQKTQTTPLGRSFERDGNPIGMCELMNSIKAPIYIERTSLATPAKVMKTRNVVRKALQYQAENKGFAFVEILAPCPIQWKMTPMEGRKWIEEHLEPVFPVQKFRDMEDTESPAEENAIPTLKGNDLIDFFHTIKDVDITAGKKDISDQLIKIAGFGGQGVLSAGVLLANCVIKEGLNSTWLPSYGPEMRGGTANANVIISQHEIGSPVVDYPNVLIAMNGPSLDAFEDKVQKDGLIVVNSSLVSRKVKRNDVRAIYIPATEIAGKLGFLATANVIMLAAYLTENKIIDMDTIKKVIPLSIKKKQYVDINLKALEEGMKYHAENKS
ncbi:MAG: 2-oxoacid:acceptor oxidoreductase family protein [Spirochaetes bacterium]|nr:2-oxoacid:acceptor oxidoreductase family protein [Spirochaetota bacterium]